MGVVDALALWSICGVACAKDVRNFSCVVGINRSQQENFVVSYYR